MTEFAISHIQVEEIDILAEKVQAISKAMMVTTPGEFDGLVCGNLHHGSFLACNESAKGIREKLKEIENGNATDLG